MFQLHSQCLEIKCSKKKCNPKTNSTKTYLICNKNENQTFRDAFCSFPNEKYQNWFDKSNFITALYDTPNNFHNQECKIDFNLSTFISNHTKDLFQESACSETMHCSTPIELQYTVEAVKRGNQTGRIMFGFFLTIGLLAVLGNLAVICNSLHFLLRKNAKRIIEMRIYRLLILHLSFADFLMGCYLLGLIGRNLTYIARRKNNELLKNEGGTFCMILGYVNFVSSQISISAIITITGLRLFSVVFPYKKVRIKIILGIIVSTWIFWLTIASIPIFDECCLNTVFTDEITITDFETRKHTTVRYSNLLFLVKNILGKINDNCRFTSGEGYKLSNNPSWTTLIEIARKLDLFPSNIKENLINLGYYNSWWVCTMRFFLSHKNPSSLFTLPIICFNVLAFSFIFVAQLIIIKNTSNFFRFCRYQRNSNDRCESSIQRQRKCENRKMRRRMFLIVMTDFCCWIPISFLALDFYRRSFSSSSCQFFIHTLWIEYHFPNVLPFIIPLNSALNPFIYSCRYWGPLQKFCLKCCHKKLNQQSET